MIDKNCITSRPRRALRHVVTLSSCILLLCTLPAGARLSGAIGVAGAGHSLKDTLDETTGLFGEMVSAVIDGDDEAVSELMGEVAKTPGKLIKRAFPVLEAPHMLAEKLKSAKQKIERFAGGVKEGLADARAALAVDRDGTNGGWSDASLLEGEPLQAPADTAFTTPNYESPAAVFAALKGGAGHAPGTTGAGSADTSWDFEKWVIAEQEANPHCYGVVDPETLPPECFGQVDAESPAVKSGADRVDDSPQAGASDWASGNWTVEGDGWSGWDKSDLRYSDDDREAARVGVFAANCWGVYEVSRSHGLYELMRERMQRNECPNEEKNPASSDDAGNEYTTALADVFEGDSTTLADGDYLTALNDLEEKEAERLRLEGEARQRQARLEAEERERRARLEAEEERERRARREAQRRADERERQRQREYDLAEQRQQAEYRRQALQNTAESLRGLAEQLYGGGGTSGGSGTSDAMCYHTCWDGSVKSYRCDSGPPSCPFRYDKP